MVNPGGEPRWVLVVDPIDGTRPAMAGFESACVSVAAAPLDDEPTMADVEVGCVVEIKSGARFLAVRGEGLEPAPRLSSQTSTERMLWTYGFRGRPVVATTTVLEELLDGSSVAGGTFDLGSATYDMTRLVTGQLDAYVEPGPRMIEEIDWMRAEFERVGRGAVLNNSPYDLAAAALILDEAGAVLTDASGARLDDCPLLGLRPRVPDVVRLRRKRRAARGDHRLGRRRHRAPARRRAPLSRVGTRGACGDSLSTCRRGAANDRRTAADHRLQPRTGPVRPRRERRAGHQSRRRRPRHRADRPGDAPQGPLGRIGDDRRGRRGRPRGRRPDRDRARGRLLRGRPRRLRPGRLRPLLQRHRQPAALVHAALPVGPLERAGHPRRGEGGLAVRLQGRQRRHRPVRCWLASRGRRTRS